MSGDIVSHSSALLFAVEMEDRRPETLCVRAEQDHCVELRMVVTSIKECAYCGDGNIFIV